MISSKRLLTPALLLLAVATAGATAAAPPVAEPYKVVVEQSGGLLVADGGGGGGRIFRVNPRSGSRSVFAGDGRRAFTGPGPAKRVGLGRVTDVAVGTNGAVYAVASSRVVKIDRSGRLSVIVRLKNAIGIGLDRTGGIYVTDDVGGRLLKITAGRTRVVARGFEQPVGVAVASDGAVYVASGHNGGARLERVAADGTKTVVTSLKLAAFVTAVGDGSLLVVDHVGHDTTGKVIRVAADGAISTLSSGQIPAPLSAVRAPSGEIYVTNFGTPGIGRLDPATGRSLPLG